MDLMSLTARDLSNKCLEAFRLCLTFHGPDPGLSNQDVSHDERFEYRLADFNLWIDGIGALAPSKASLDARLSERPIDLSLVKGNLVMLFQSLEDCLSLLKDNASLEDILLDIDSALESLVTLSLAIRRTGRRSRLHKADRLFNPEEHTQLQKHLEAIILLRPGPGPCCREDEFRTKMKSLTPLQSHLVTANLKRRNRFIQAQLHSLGLKKRSVGFELPVPETTEQNSALAPSQENRIGGINMPPAAPIRETPNRPLSVPISVTSASIPESKLQYKEPISKRIESAPMTVITQITASARYPRPKISDNEQKVVQCPCCCQILPVLEAKDNNRWRKHLAEDIRPYTCIFDRCPTPDVYYSSRSMLEQHFRQDHPPGWVCPLCDATPVYWAMTEMMDHLHSTHPQSSGDDIPAIISSSAQTRMGIESCPLCEVKGDTDSPELIDHVLEHVHDFSLRSLPWPRPSEADIGGEVGSFNSESGGGVAITQWLECYEHEMEDEEIDPTLKLAACDYGRLPIITEQIRSEGQDKLGIDIGFADEHGDESAEAETDISQLTQLTTESASEFAEKETLYRCLDCSDIFRWIDGGPLTQCVECQSKRVEPINPENDPDHEANYAAVLDSLDRRHSVPATRESTSGFRRFTDRLFSRKKPDNVEPQQHNAEDIDLVQYFGVEQKAIANQKAWKILISVYHRRLESPTRTQSMFENFIRDVQNEDVRVVLPVSDPRSFLEAMVKFYLNPLKHLPPKDLTKPISNYFISSSHKTLLTRSGKAYNAIQDMLYFGYRSIELEVWNGYINGSTDDEEPNPEVEEPRKAVKRLNRFFGLDRATNTQKPMDPKTTDFQSGNMSSPTEPIVTDHFTVKTPCGFREACQVIRKSAFVSTDLPLIVNLEVCADSSQQELMVKIMTEEWHDILLDRPLEACDPRFRLPTLQYLRGRILIRFIDQEAVRVAIIQPLAELGVYMRGEQFNNFDTPRTKSPTHLFSMQEDKVQELISTSANALFAHNQTHFFRVYPSPAIEGTSNLDPLRFWRYGIQMAGIVRPHVDEGMMLNEGMFADESGWVLKPDGYRSSNRGISCDLVAGPRKSLGLSIFAFKDQEFMTTAGLEIKNLASFMMVSLHIHDEEKPRVARQELNTTENESGALGYNLNFLVTRAEATIIPKLCILRLTFLEGLSKDHPFAWASLRLDRLNQGFRLVQLYDSKGLIMMQQRILLKFNIRWE